MADDKPLVWLKGEVKTVVVLDVFNKKTKATPHAVMDNGRRRLRAFQILMEGKRT